MKLHDNYMCLEFPSKSTNESFARTVVAAFAARMDPTIEEIGDIKTAVSEAVTNCIVHAYPNEIGIVQIKCRILRENVLEIIVKDRGRGIENLSRAMEPLFTTGNEERSGMGFTIMENFMTSLKVKSSVGKGTTIHMRRKIVNRGDSR